jgi:hypothetical protein
MRASSWALNFITLGYFFLKPTALFASGEFHEGQKVLQVVIKQVNGAYSISSEITAFDSGINYDDFKSPTTNPQCNLSRT